MHVSKPPKEGSHANNFYKQLKQTAQRYNNVTVEGVHKKINLADVQLAWEHERFSMKRMSAFTLSSLKSHKDVHRTSVFEHQPAVQLALAQRNAKILAETLANYIYGSSNGFAQNTGSNDLNEIFAAATVSSNIHILYEIVLEENLYNGKYFIYVIDRRSQSNRSDHGCIHALHWLIMI